MCYTARVEEIFSSPGMIAVTVLIVVVQAVSVLFMMLVIHLFRRQRSKYDGLLRGMRNDTALGTPGRILIPLYIVVTLVVAVVTVYLFLFQPHLL